MIYLQIVTEFDAKAPQARLDYINSPIDNIALLPNPRNAPITNAQSIYS